MRLGWFDLNVDRLSVHCARCSVQCARCSRTWFLCTCSAPITLSDLCHTGLGFCSSVGPPPHPSSHSSLPVLLPSLPALPFPALSLRLSPLPKQKLRQTYAIHPCATGASNREHPFVLCSPRGMSNNSGWTVSIGSVFYSCK